MSRVLNSIIQAQNMAIPRHGEIIYHYLGFDTLMSILNSGQLWFTSLREMNDPREVEYGVEFLTQIFCNCLKEQDNSFNISDSEIEDAVYQSITPVYENIFVSCFSQEGDRLSLWRAYGQDGFGASIGISKNRILSLPAFGSDQSFFATPIIYTSRKKEIVRTAVVSDVEAMLLKMSAEEFFSKRLVQYIRSIAAIPLLLKSDEYQEEHEWRVILKINPTLRRSSSSIVEEINGRQTVRMPLSTLLGPENQIDEVIIGPSRSGPKKAVTYKIRAELSAASEAQKIRIGHIKSSKIDYRPRSGEVK